MASAIYNSLSFLATGGGGDDLSKFIAKLALSPVDINSLNQNEQPDEFQCDN